MLSRLVSLPACQWRGCILSRTPMSYVGVLHAHLNVRGSHDWARSLEVPWDTDSLITDSCS
jgi:hypothetical protein